MSKFPEVEHVCNNFYKHPKQIKKEKQMETNLNQIEHIQKSNESFYAFMDKFAETIRAYQKHVEDLQAIAAIAKKEEEEKNQLNIFKD